MRGSEPESVREEDMSVRFIIVRSIDQSEFQLRFEARNERSELTREPFEDCLLLPKCDLELLASSSSPHPSRIPSRYSHEDCRSIVGHRNL